MLDNAFTSVPSNVHAGTTLLISAAICTVLFVIIVSVIVIVSEIVKSHHYVKIRQ